MTFSDIGKHYITGIHENNPFSRRYRCGIRYILCIVGMLYDPQIKKLEARITFEWPLINL